MAKRTRKSTQVNANFRLAFRLAAHLGLLALTLVELQFVRKSTQVFRRLATQRKSTQVDRKSSAYMREIYDFLPRLAWTYEPSQLRIHLATHHKSERKFWFCKFTSTYESVWPALKRVRKPGFSLSSEFSNIPHCTSFSRPTLSPGTWPQDCRLYWYALFRLDY